MIAKSFSILYEKLLVVLAVIGFASCSTDPGAIPVDPAPPYTSPKDSTFLASVQAVLDNSSKVFVQQFYYDSKKRLSLVASEKKPSGSLVGTPVYSKELDSLYYTYASATDTLVTGILKKFYSYDNLGQLTGNAIVRYVFWYDNTGRIAGDSTIVNGGTGSGYIELTNYTYTAPGVVNVFSKSITPGTGVQTSNWTLSLQYDNRNNLLRQVQPGIQRDYVYSNFISPFKKIIKLGYSFTPVLYAFNMNPLLQLPYASATTLGVSSSHSNTSPPTVVNSSMTYTYRNDGYPLTVNFLPVVQGPSNLVSATFAYYKP